MEKIWGLSCSWIALHQFYGLNLGDFGIKLNCAGTVVQILQITDTEGKDFGWFREELPRFWVRV